MDKALSAIVSGRVQMVMYRDYTRDRALELNLVGEVENVSDGTVRVYAEGAEEKINQFIDFLQKGSPLSKVEQVACEWGEPQGGFDTFVILRGVQQ